MSVLPLHYGRDVPKCLNKGVREQMRQLLVTRFMFYAALVVGIIIICLGLILWLEMKHPEKDNTALHLGILGFATTNIGVVLLKASTDRNQIVLQEQNVVLDSVHDKVNGGTTKMLDALKAEHREALEALRSEAQRERHTLKGDLHTEMLRVEHFQTENLILIQNMQSLRERVNDLTQKLADCAKGAGKAEGKLEAISEAKTEANQRQDQGDC